MKVATFALFFAGLAAAIVTKAPIHPGDAAINTITSEFTKFNNLAATVKMQIRGLVGDADKHHLNTDDAKKLNKLLDDVEKLNQAGSKARDSATHSIEGDGDVDAIVALVHKTLDKMGDEIKRIRGLEIGRVITDAHFRYEREKRKKGKK